MPPDTQKHKTTKITLPKVQAPALDKIVLPYGGEIPTSDKLLFSFACFDHTHELFNLGGDDAESGTVPANWFIDLLDCLKSVSNKKIHDLKGSIYDLHPVNWKTANTHVPAGSEQCEYWQFRINKSKGRIIGIRIPGVFYIVWLDPHHNLTDSAGYGGVTYYKPGKSEYEKLVEQLNYCQEQNAKLEQDLRAADELLKELER